MRQIFFRKPFTLEQSYWQLFRQKVFYPRFYFEIYQNNLYLYIYRKYKGSKRYRLIKLINYD